MLRLAWAQKKHKYKIPFRYLPKRFVCTGVIFMFSTGISYNEAESAIQKMLNGLPASMTVIVIAHRLNTIKNCDRIVVMNHGTIAEQGTHQELLERKGIYWRLWK